MSRSRVPDVPASQDVSRQENVGPVEGHVAVKSLTKVLNVTLEMAASPPRSRLDLAQALAKKGVALTGVAASATDSRALQVTTLVGDQFLQTLSLTKLAGFTPGKASIYITLAMAEKVVSAAGLAGFDKCKSAVASLSAATGMGALQCFFAGPATMGIGCLPGAISIAAEAFEVYAQCYARRPGPGQACTPRLDSAVPVGARLP